MKQVFSKLLSAALMAAMLLSTPAFAAEASGAKAVTADGGSGVSSVELTVTGDDLPYLFSAALPAAIPASVSTEGTVTVPSNIEIRNNSDVQAIKVTDILVTPSSGWALAGYESGDFAAVNGKRLGLSLRGDPLDSGSGRVTLSEDNWNIGKSDALPVPMGLKINPQATAGSTETVSKIGFTLDWSEVDGTSGKPTPPAKDYFTITFDPGDHGSITGETSLQILKADLADSNEVKITFPPVTADAGYTLDRWVVSLPGGAAEEIGETIAITGDMILRAMYTQQQDNKVYLTFSGGDHGSVRDDNGVLRSAFTRELSVSGGFDIEFPAVAPSAGWMLLKWVNTSDGSLALDPATGEGNALNDGTNRFHFTAVYEEASVRVAFKAGAGGMLLDPDTKQPASTLTQDFIPDADGRFSVTFPAAQPSAGKQFDKWVNTRSGTPVDSGLEWVIPNKTMEFTAVFKEQPTVILKISCGPGGSVSSTGDITLPNDGSMVPLPTATTNSGYRFDGWYYVDGDGSRIAQTGDTYAIDYSGGRGTVNSGNNTVTVRIMAKFSVLGKNSSAVSDMEADEPCNVQALAPEASGSFEISLPG